MPINFIRGSGGSQKTRIKSPDLYLVCFETSGPGKKNQKFVLGLKNRGLLPVNWETPVKRRE